MRISNSFSWVLNPIQSIHSYHIFLHSLLYPVIPLSQVFCQYLSITIAYPNLEFNSFSLTLLVPMSASLRPPSQHTVVCKLHSSTFLTELIHLEMCLVRQQQQGVGAFNLSISSLWWVSPPRFCYISYMITVCFILVWILFWRV